MARVVPASGACDATSLSQPEADSPAQGLNLKAGPLFTEECHWIDDPPDPGPPGGVTITRWECHEDLTGPGNGGGSLPDPGAGGGGGGGGSGQEPCNEIIPVTCTPGGGEGDQPPGYDSPSLAHDDGQQGP